MAAHKSLPWTSQEVATLREHYPAGGLNAVLDMLPQRSWKAIYVMANKLGLRTTATPAAPEAKLRGKSLEQAIEMREGQGWSFSRIGAHFGISESAACNAVLNALCARRGYTPAQRDAKGRLTDEGVERLRLALRKGLKAVDIQLRLGLSASRIAEERRRYNADLKVRGKAPLPPAGGGMAYSGAKVAKSKRVEAEALFMQGLGTQKVSARTGVSKTVCTRIRTRLVNRLKRKGESLPGCDANGTRHVQAESIRFVTAEQVELLQAMLMDRVPVMRAATQLALGSCTAYRIRDALAADLASQGKALPVPIRAGRVPAGAFREADWPPNTQAELYAFRAMLGQMPFAQAKDAWRSQKRAERRAEEKRPKTFEEQLALVAEGKLKVIRTMPRAHLMPTAINHRSAA